MGHGNLLDSEEKLGKNELLVYFILLHSATSLFVYLLSLESVFVLLIQSQNCRIETLIGAW